MVELIYQTQKKFDKLSFLYLITGDLSKLSKMETIAERRGDISSVILNTIYSNSAEKRGAIFEQAGSLSLAYAVAKANNDDTTAARILEAADINEEDIVLPEASFEGGYAMQITSCH